MHMNVSRTPMLAAALLATWCSAAAYPQISRSDTPPSDSATANRSPADRAMADRVYDALKADPMNYYRHVTVRADHGVITLGGFVTDDSSQAKAKKIAQGVQGVTKVVDQMELQPKGRSGGEE
jgi:hyperosmotically inducible protein